VIWQSVVALIKLVAAALGLYRQESELAAGRAEQRDDDRRAMDEGKRQGEQAKRDADARHAANPTDDAFDPDFWRKE